MRIFYMLFALYFSAHLYVFICLRRAFGGGKWQIAAAIFLACMASSWLFRFGRPAGPLTALYQDIGFFWMGFLIFLCYCLITADLAALAARAAALLLHLRPGGKLYAFASASRYVPAAIGLAVLLFCYGLYEARSPRIVEVPVVSGKLTPDSPPLRIAGIADVHISSLIGTKSLQRMADAVASVDPDIVVAVGDIVDTDLASDKEHAAILRSIPARLGKIAITGNHEAYWGGGMSLDFLQRAGFRVLREEALRLGGIVIAGVDDGTFASRMPSDTADVMRLLATLPEESFVLLLNHKPYYPQEGVGRFDLQFSGHTHGGQFWPGGYVTRHIYGLPQGMNILSREGRTSLLYIGNGLGFWGPPIRFLTPPEIPVFILMPEKRAGGA